MSIYIFCPGFATEVQEENLKFILNWSGPHIQDMNVDDRVCQTALIKLLRALEDLQPTIEGIIFDVSLVQF